VATAETWPPDYVAEFAKRQSRLLKIRGNPAMLLGAKEYYRTRPHEFVDHWTITYDPRNAGSETPATLPFILFKRQRELVDFLLACMDAETDGLAEKCRDLGATWTCCAFSVWLWLYWPGAAVGWGSRKEQLVDKIGDPDSIFEKMRLIIRHMPRELLPAEFRPLDHMAYMKLINPENGATITGEAGDNIGRGGRKLIYFKDESAHYERPEKIEAALGDNTRVQIDVSSVNGLGNVFHRKRESGVEWAPGQAALKGATNVFVMDWRDHPAKTQDWYDLRKAKAEADGLLHVFAQEVDRNYSASVEGVIIPADWVASAMDAHLTLGFDDSGGWRAALDPFDEGGDLHALALAKGVVVKSVEAWGDGDTGDATRRAVEVLRGKTVELQYDCIGIGAGVKAEANRLKADNLLPPGLSFVPWSASASPLNPDARVIPGDRESPLNRDFYKNLKAQAWWELRRRFERTHNAVTAGEKHDPATLISLPAELPGLATLRKELSQATRSKTGALKLVVNKTPEGTKSPNMADALVMAFWPLTPPSTSITSLRL
jgi:hypothetical protein